MLAFALLSTSKSKYDPQMGAVSFIETMDHASLSCITHEEFER
jgi:hypothetical protein